MGVHSCKLSILVTISTPDIEASLQSNWRVLQLLSCSYDHTVHRSVADNPHKDTTAALGMYALSVKLPKIELLPWADRAALN